ncbi:unnamed protein product [Eruca vesicaria subsp. sativa]|uniref:BON domain-containing protein n=1 Tax=Eruca vesicaria subsp. sativa TaxID=29727 RepID=A0ABC8LK89_ERUVS|nr:unnamed protein product [Eruca vesicaria subsp. sativa]
MKSKTETKRGQERGGGRWYQGRMHVYSYGQKLFLSGVTSERDFLENAQKMQYRVASEISSTGIQLLISVVNVRTLPVKKSIYAIVVILANKIMQS